MNDNEIINQEYKVMLVFLRMPFFDAAEEIGICSIAAYLRQKGITVKIISGLEEKIDYNSIYEYNPNFIGFTVYNSSKDAILRVCSKIKAVKPDISICFGGYCSSFHYEEILQETTLVDYVVRGEGEITTYKLVNALSSNSNIDNIAGLCYRKDNNIYINEDPEVIQDINTIPWPARDILKDNKLKVAQISTSRGCLRNCSFCITPVFWKGKNRGWRGRDIMDVIDEMEYLHKEFNIYNFEITDCSFEDPCYNDHERVWQFTNELIKRKLNITYFTHFRAEFSKSLDEKKLKLLKDSGLYSVFIGVESASEINRKTYGKAATIEDNNNTIKLFTEEGISVHIGFIGINPYSQLEDLYLNVDWLYQNNYLCDLFKFTEKAALYKGTPLYTKAKQDNILINTNYSNAYEYKISDYRVVEIDKFFDEIQNNNLIMKYADIYWLLYEFNEYLLSSKQLINMRISDSEEKQQVLAELDRYMNRVKQENIIINENNYRWIKKVLDKVKEPAWEEEKVNLMTELSDEASTKKQIMELNKMKKNFYKYTNRLNEEYKKVFNSNTGTSHVIG